MDLRDVWRPGSGLTWRRLAVLIRGLPEASRTATWRRDNEVIVIDKAKASELGKKFGPWGTDHYQRATTNDLLRQLIHATFAAQGHKVSRKYEPSPRPMPKVRWDNSTAVAELRREQEEHEARRRAAGLT